MKKLLIVVAVLSSLVACGGGGSSPTQPNPPNNPPPASTFIVSGTVTETAPTASTTIANATVTFIDGTGTRRSATSDGSGNYNMSGLPGAGYTIDVTAQGYAQASIGLSITGNTMRNFQLDPAFQMLTSTRDESVSGGDACVGGPSTFGDGCKQYLLNIHHSGTIDATVTWQDGDTWIWLELYRSSDNQMIAQGQSSRINGLRQQVSTSASARTQYVIRVRYVFGSRITPFSLTVTRPS